MAVAAAHSVVQVAANPFWIFSIPPLIVQAPELHDHLHNQNHYVALSNDKEK